MMLLLKCPQCKNEMKYQTNDTLLKNKRKTCVYCGKNFKIGNYVIRKLE